MVPPLSRRRRHQEFEDGDLADVGPGYDGGAPSVDELSLAGSAPMPKRPLTAKMSLGQVLKLLHEFVEACREQRPVSVSEFIRRFMGHAEGVPLRDSAMMLESCATALKRRVEQFGTNLKSFYEQIVVRATQPALSFRPRKRARGRLEERRKLEGAVGSMDYERNVFEEARWIGELTLPTTEALMSDTRIQAVRLDEGQLESMINLFAAAGGATMDELLEDTDMLGGADLHAPVEFEDDAEFESVVENLLENVRRRYNLPPSEPSITSEAEEPTPIFSPAPLTVSESHPETRTPAASGAMEGPTIVTTPIREQFLRSVDDQILKPEETPPTHIPITGATDVEMMSSPSSDVEGLHLEITPMESLLTEIVAPTAVEPSTLPLRSRGGQPSEFVPSPHRVRRRRAISIPIRGPARQYVGESNAKLLVDTHLSRPEAAEDTVRLELLMKLFNQNKPVPLQKRWISQMPSLDGGLCMGIMGVFLELQHQQSWRLVIDENKREMEWHKKMDMLDAGVTFGISVILPRSPAAAGMESEPEGVQEESEIPTETDAERPIAEPTSTEVSGVPEQARIDRRPPRVRRMRIRKRLEEAVAPETAAIYTLIKRHQAARYQPMKFSEMTRGAPRVMAAKRLVQLLELKTKGYAELRQDEPFGEIQVEVVPEID